MICEGCNREVHFVHGAGPAKACTDCHVRYCEIERNKFEFDPAIEDISQEDLDYADRVQGPDSRDLGGEG